MALKQFQKTFALTELKKGYFPHFNTEAHQGYVGPLSSRLPTILTRSYSLQCLHWLNWVMHQYPDLHTQHARNGGEYGTYPVGYPEIKDHPLVSDLFELHGLIQCRVLPPLGLYHPVLPYCVQGKLLYPLCRACAEAQLAGSCPYGDEDRAWIGTYVSKELQSSKGQRISRRLFRPRRLHQGDSVKRRSHLRSCSHPKACLNKHWGKFGQRVGFDKTEYISSPKRFFALLRDECCVVKDVHFVNEDLVCVTYEPQSEFHQLHSAHNVVIAAWLTAQACLKLYSYLKPLDRRVLYFDTDSIINIHRALSYNPLLGDTLGELTDELEGGNSIQTFVWEDPRTTPTSCGILNLTVV
ncbi:uncharacterized protein LOC124276936 [Haliotis rubra]|uniref:uncharacterized protein LOC124276936 n=1 Tax=Haliotis rubra TaxID=36100 RepID=UPI001EE511BD|nr:uncharacterized protein LOC124276936 [Haliotis rubra]